LSRECFVSSKFDHPALSTSNRSASPALSHSPFVHPRVCSSRAWASDASDPIHEPDCPDEFDDRAELGILRFAELRGRLEAALRGRRVVRDRKRRPGPGRERNRDARCERLRGVDRPRRRP
jgi:hypothetical protein